VIIIALKMLVGDRLKYVGLVAGVAFAALAFVMPWQIPVFGGVAILICCLLAGLISVRRVIALEPAVVFRG